VGIAHQSSLTTDVENGLYTRGWVHMQWVTEIFKVSVIFFVFGMKSCVHQSGCYKLKRVKDLTGL